MKDEPHRISDDEPCGEATVHRVVTRRKRRRKLIIPVSFDDTVKEFDLWNYIYDLRDSIEQEIEFLSTPDYKNRIQEYEIVAENKILNKLRLWLMKNNFKYSLDKE